MTVQKPLPDIVDILEYSGEEYMFYKEIPLDTVLIRGTVCDEMGNLTTTEEAMKLEVLPAVLAAKKIWWTRYCTSKTGGTVRNDQSKGCNGSGSIY